MLELRSVSTRYGPVQILWDVSLEVHPGELVCLLGGNASGKSTTMKTIMGLVHPFKGEVLFRQFVRGIRDLILKTGMIVAHGPWPFP